MVPNDTGGYIDSEQDFGQWSPGASSDPHRLRHSAGNLPRIHPSGAVVPTIYDTQRVDGLRNQTVESSLSTLESLIEVRHLRRFVRHSFEPLAHVAFLRRSSFRDRRNCGI